MKKTTAAVAAPTTISRRHASFLVSASMAFSESIPDHRSVSVTRGRMWTSVKLSSPIRRKPTLAVAPMRPAVSARGLSGHNSVTSETPSAYSPPIPSEATNLSEAICHASEAKPRSPVKLA